MSLLNELKSKIDEHSIISFDIFDTLLLRPYVKPTDLFKHLEHIENARGFKHDRVQAESFARKVNSTKEDVTFDEIYNEIDDRFIDLKNKEMDLERKVLFANPEMKAVFDYALQNNKMVIITSDMYLPKEFLAEVLKEKGFSGYHNFYLSCDVNKTKHTGRLFEYIISDLKVKASDILHIGDNKHADFMMAQKNGLSAYHYEKAIDRLFAANERVRKFYERNEENLSVSIILGILSIYTLQQSTNYWYDFGFKYGGPVVYGYMQWLNQQLIEDDIKEAMFVARDGYSLQKVFDIIKTADIKSHYYYSPRIVNLACNLNYKLNMKFGEYNGLVTLRLILSYFKSKDKFLAKNTPDIKNCSEGEAFICKHKKLFKKLSVNETFSYQEYLKHFNVLSDKIALVDTCTMAMSSHKSLQIGLPDRDIVGYYWFTAEGNQEEITKYQTRTYQVKHSQEFVDWNMMELFMTAPTPPADRIENGKVIFKDINPQEKVRIEIYPDLSEGIVDFAKLAKQIFGNLSLFLDVKKLTEWVNVLCTIPTDLDKEKFATIQHAWDAGHYDYVPLPAPWFDESLQNIKYEYTTSWVRLFNLVSIFKKEIKGKVAKSYVFDKILVLKEKYKNNSRRLKLFGFIPFGRIKYSEKGDDVVVYRMYLLGLPLVKISKQTNLIKAEKTKIYLLGVRFLTLKRSKM